MWRASVAGKQQHRKLCARFRKKFALKRLRHACRIRNCYRMVRERDGERERERESVCVCVFERERERARGGYNMAAVADSSNLL